LPVHLHEPLKTVRECVGVTTFAGSLCVAITTWQKHDRHTNEHMSVCASIEISLIVYVIYS